MTRLHLTLLGGFHARLEPGSAIALPTRKSQALLAYLALPLGRAHPRDKLAALLGGGLREAPARASLRQALFAVRRALQTRRPCSRTATPSRSGQAPSTSTPLCSRAWCARGRRRRSRRPVRSIRGICSAG